MARRSSGPVGRRLGVLAEDVQLSQVLENPRDYLAVQLSGASRRLRFPGGFVFPADRRNKKLARALVGLAAHGARYSEGPPGFPDRWQVDARAREIVTPSGIRFGLDSVNPMIFSETFIYDIHHVPVDLAGRTVVDVGANVGDSTLFFASLGARVVAYEPDPANFQRLRANVARNPGLASRIRLVEQAVGTDGPVRFHSGLGGASGMHEEGGTVIEVPSVSLKTLVASLGDPRPALLKADCKGAEFAMAAQREIRAFERVSIEYIADLGLGTVEDLIELLRQDGFTRFRTFKHNSGPYPTSITGIVEAE